ncbi:MAG: Na+/H+ antiporter subunit E [Vallitaleaceae bacterium]|jgi:multicomponent Na+:H+ antiporter subunit E|nr:Na+/H+ antiporter subunit E [Vallitaleaceae bacterium]
MRKFISTFIVLWGVWLLISGFAINEVILGGVVAIILAIILNQYFGFEMSVLFPVQAIKFIFIYVPLFIYKLVVANIQVAVIVLNPKLPIKPGFVRVRTAIESDLGKLTLANSITLTPGTLSIDIRDDEILVHWIKVEEEKTGKISLDFEKILGGIFK